MTVETSASELLQRYDGFLLDSFGVLVHHGGLFEGAASFIAALNERQLPFAVLTNDASRLPGTIAAWYARVGLAIAEERIIPSGALIERYFADQQFAGRRCVVLGPEDSHTFVERAGGVVVPWDDNQLEVLVVCDDRGYPMLEALDGVITGLFHQIDRGVDVELVLPNPDIIYPKGNGAYGITSGAVSLVIEAALHNRYPEVKRQFVSLGKPHPPMYEAGLALLGLERHRVLMIGDQLATDIAGANAVGLDSALVATGLNSASHATAVQPTWSLPSLVV